jgi:hypothetical protein
MLIKTLENSEISSVVFIRDYLQFYFEGEQNNGALTTYFLPVAVVNGQYFESNTQGYRDSLCSFINHKVKNSEIIYGQKIKLTFDNDDRLEVLIKREDCCDQEAAMLRVNNEIAVW